MNKLIIASIAIIGIAATNTSAQKLNEKDVPAFLKNSFAKEYPNVKSTKWEKEKENFEAEFEMNEIETSVLFDAQGTVLETEIEIKIAELPKVVAEFVAKNYVGKSIKEAAKITNAKHIVTYEAELKGMDLIFDSDGKFMKEVKE